VQPTNQPTPFASAPSSLTLCISHHLSLCRECSLLLSGKHVASSRDTPSTVSTAAYGWGAVCHASFLAGVCNMVVFCVSSLFLLLSHALNNQPWRCARLALPFLPLAQGWCTTASLSRLMMPGSDV
jgi:hypothetical protein